MADTHPNAFRTQATAKRLQATQLNAEADDLEAQADELEGKTKTEVPETDQKAEPEEDPKEEKTSKIPFKKQ